MLLQERVLAAGSARAGPEKPRQVASDRARRGAVRSARAKPAAAAGVRVGEGNMRAPASRGRVSLVQGVFGPGSPSG